MVNADNIEKSIMSTQLNMINHELSLERVRRPTILRVGMIGGDIITSGSKPKYVE